MDGQKHECEKVNELEIGVSELIIAILKKSWLILLCILLFSLIATCYKYMSDKEQYKVEKNNDSLTISQIEEKLSLEEKEAILEAKKMRAELSELQKYQTNSIIMNINPYAQDIITLQYYVDAGYTIDYTSANPKDYTFDLLAAYKGYITYGVLDSLSERLTWIDNDPIYQGLISVESFNNSFLITIIEENSQKAQELADAVETLLDQYHGLLTEKIGRHSLELIDRNTSVVMDETLADRQKALNAQILELENSYNAQINSFTQDQRMVLMEEPTTQISLSNKQLRFNKRYTLFGAVAGFFLSVFGIGLTYIFSKKIKTIKEIETIYKIRTIGILSPLKDNYFGRMVSKILKKEEYPIEKQRDLLLTNVSLICKRKNIQELFITTSLRLKKAQLEQIQIVVDALCPLGINAIFGANMMQNAGSLKSMAEIKNVLLFEQLNETDNFSIRKELLLCKEHEAEVIGIIIME